MSLYNFSQYDGLRPEDLAGYARRRFRDLIENPVRLGERTLPWAPVDDWKVSAGQVSFRGVASAVIGPDSVLPRGPLGTFAEREYEILKTGLKYSLIESEIRKLRQIFYPNARPNVEQIMRAGPYGFANLLTVGYLDRAEAMRIEALTTGRYVIPNSNGASVVWDSVPANHKVALLGTDAWTDYVNADGLEDLLNFNQQLIDDIGVGSEYTVMSKTAFNHLIAQTKTRNKVYAFNGNIAQQMIVGQNGNLANFPAVEMDAINAYLARNDCGPIILYDRQYQEFDFRGSTQPTMRRFLPENAFYMVAGQPIEGSMNPDIPEASATGYTADGPTVENDFRSGLYIWLAEQDEPFEIAIKSVGWVLPVITDGRTLFQGTLFA